MSFWVYTSASCQYWNVWILKNRCAIELPDVTGHCRWWPCFSACSHSVNWLTSWTLVVRLIGHQPIHSTTTWFFSCQLTGHLQIPIKSFSLDKNLETKCRHEIKKIYTVYIYIYIYKIHGQRPDPGSTSEISSRPLSWTSFILSVCWTSLECCFCSLSSYCSRTMWLNGESNWLAKPL